MDSELLALHWMEHATVFSQAIGSLRSKAAYTDATLACEGHFYPVHKFVLSTCSQYFSAIFEWTPCINPVVVINNITCKELEALLDFMYIGEVSVKDSLIPDVMRAAECLRIRGLAMVDDDGVRTQLKGKCKTDGGGPVRKRKRPSAPKKKVPVNTPLSIPASPCRPHQPSTQSPFPPPPSTSAHQDNCEMTLQQADDHVSDLPPGQHPQSNLPKSQDHETDLPHTPIQNSAAPSFPSTQISPSPQPLQAVHSSPSDPANNQNNQFSSTHLPNPLYANETDLATHESSHEVTMNSALAPTDVVKSLKMELQESKPHALQVQGATSSEEIPDLLDSLVDMPPIYESKPEQVEEDAAFHSGEPDDNLYEFTDELPSASAASHQEVRFQRGPATSSSSNKFDVNSVEEKPSLKCPYCGKQWQKKDSLNRHIRIHTKEPYNCNQCSFTAKSYKLCLEHKKKEHKVLHKCTVCDFSSHRHDNVKRHMAKHSCDKPHQCPECKFSTKRLHSLQKHIKSKHEKK